MKSIIGLLRTQKVRISHNYRFGWMGVAGEEFNYTQIFRSAVYGKKTDSPCEEELARKAARRELTRNVESALLFGRRWIDESSAHRPTYSGGVSFFAPSQRHQLTQLTSNMWPAYGSGFKYFIASRRVLDRLGLTSGVERKFAHAAVLPVRSRVMEMVDGPDHLFILDRAFVRLVALIGRDLQYIERGGCAEWLADVGFEITYPEAHRVLSTREMHGW